ncbi:MAG: amidohydrolase [Opitutaceae bacterium]|nr:amidohydrolase [Cytophagales bacterium]
MDLLSDRIKKIAGGISAEVISFRRHLHQNPELSFKEFKTSEFIAQTLLNKKIEIEYIKEGIAQTGLVAYIKGKNPGKKMIALRADMDALPIIEQNVIDYKSINEGVMHACGHDVHSSSLLGTAIILNELKDQFEGTIKLVFQPGEELIPGGASLMIKAGILKEKSLKSMFGQHVAPQIEVGKVGFRSGIYMASADEIYLTVKGKGGHAAMPDNAVDPVLITAHIIIALQQVVSRNANPKIPTVLSFGKVIAEGATNIIPNEVKVAGTFRTLNEEWRSEAKKRITKIATGIAESMGGTCDVNILDGYPYLENNPLLTDRAKVYAKEFLGEENVVDLDIWMASEDFAYYTHHVDSCFYRLGVRNETLGITSGVHTPTFNVDEKALEVGSGLMAWLALKELEIK